MPKASQIRTPNAPMAQRGDSSQIRRREPVVKERMKLMRSPTTEEALEKIEKDDQKKGRRTQYAPMRAHMEAAAHIIALGGTSTMAARRAGVSPRQIKKYRSDPDFRARVQELQETLGSKVRGKVMREIDRRTAPELIKKMEILDLLRVGDRFGLGRGSGNTVINDNSQHTSYEAIFAEIVTADAAGESADFPAFESEDVSLSGGDSPLES